MANDHHDDSALTERHGPDHWLYLAGPTLYIRIIECSGQNVYVGFQVYLVIELIVGYKCRRQPAADRDRKSVV